MSDEQRLNRRIYTRENLREMGVPWCDSTMKRKIAAGEFPAPITPPGATRWWQVEAVDAALLDRRPRGKTKLHRYRRQRHRYWRQRQQRSRAAPIPSNATRVYLAGSMSGDCGMK